MFIHLIISIFAGILVGTFTGLIPGIHINLISATIVSILPFLLLYSSPISLVIFIVSMSVTHVFMDFIPSIYLGAPEESSSLAVLPGHELLLEGKGHEAVTYSVYGCFYAAIFSVIITPLFIIILPKAYPFIQRMMGFILVVGSIFLISKEEKSKIWAVIIFLLSGFLGFITFNINITQPLLPLLSGLFGASTLIYSISQKTKIPEQKLETKKLDKKELLKPLVATTTICPICSFLPGLGSSQAAILSTQFIKPTREQFLFSLGAVNIILMILSFSTLYSINKSRTGSAAMISEIIKISLKDLTVILISCILVSIMLFFIARKISKIFAKNISKINYSKVSIIILIILTTLVFTFSGLMGVIIYSLSLILGMLTIYLDIRKGHLMGCLLIPSIIYYLPF